MSAFRNSTTLAIIACVVLVLALLGIVSLAGDPHATSPSSAPSGSTDSRRALTQLGGPDEGREPIASLDDHLPRPQHPELRLYVEDESAQPIAGACCEATPEPGASLFTAPDPPAAATTNEEGRATVLLPTWTLYRLEVSRDGFATARFSVAPGESHVVLTRAASVLVRTFDVENEHPLDSVTIQFVRQGRSQVTSASTSDGGQLALRSLEPGTYTIETDAKGYLDRTLRAIDVSASGENRIDIALSRGLTIRGQVIDAQSGEPLREGWVETSHPLLPEKRAPIGRDGTFALTGLAHPSPEVRVLARGISAGHRSFDVQPRFDSRTGVQSKDALIRVVRGPVIRGVVRGNGVPISGAAVLLAQDVLRAVAAPKIQRFGLAQTITAEDGSFEIALGKEDHARRSQVLVLAPGWTAHLEEISSDADLSIRIDLDPSRTWMLRAVDSSGHPEACARIAATLRGRLPDVIQDGAVLDALGTAILSDAEGAARVEGLCRGEWDIEVTSADRTRYGRAEITVTDRLPDPVEIVLDGSRTILGKVVDLAGDAISNVDVRWEGGSLRRYWTRTDSAGCFQLHLPRAGAAKLFVLSRLGWKPFETRTGSTVELRIDQPEEDPWIRCDVIDAASGKPVLDIQRTLTTGSSKGTEHVFVGSFQFKVSPVDPFELAVEAPGYGGWAQRFESVPADRSIKVALVRAATDSEGAQTLRVSLAAKDHTADVIVFDAGSKRELARVYSPNGIDFDIPLRGRSAICWTVAGWEGCLPATQTWRRGDPDEVRVELRKQGARVRGHASTPQADGLLLELPDGMTAKIPLGLDREFTTFLLAPGTYRLSALSGPSKTLTVRDGDRLDVDL